MTAASAVLVGNDNNSPKYNKLNQKLAKARVYVPVLFKGWTANKFRFGVSKTIL